MRHALAVLFSLTFSVPQLTSGALGGLFRFIVVLQIMEVMQCVISASEEKKIDFSCITFYSFLTLNYGVTKNINIFTYINMLINLLLHIFFCCSAVRGTPTKPKRVATPKRATGPKRARAAQLSSEEEELEEEVPKRKTKRLKSDSEDESVPLVSLVGYIIVY